MHWKLILLAIISILIGLYMNNRMKEYEKDKEIELASRYATYRNIFYILALLLSFGAIWVKINKKSDKYSYKIVNMSPEDDDIVNYEDLPTSEEIKAKWIQKFANLKGKQKKGNKLLEKFREKYGPYNENLESIVMASIENEKCALGKKFTKSLAKKRDECFDFLGIEKSQFDYPLARGKSYSIKEIPCNQIQEINKGLGADITSHCQDTLTRIKAERFLPVGYTIPSKFSSKTREIGGPSVPRQQ